MEINDNDIRKQQEAYSIPGVDEESPAFIAAEAKKKRKQELLLLKESQPQKKQKIITSIYVQDLPTDTTIAEIAEYFKKCGIILTDTESGLPKIKLYTDGEGRLKGDALVVYFKPESVKMAIDLLDESMFRPTDSKPIKVSKAVFQEKERTEEEIRDDKRRIDKNRLRRKMMKLEQKLDWDQDDDQSNNSTKEKTLKTVVLKNMFSLGQLQEEPELLLDLKEEIREECEKFGTVTNVILYDLEQEGVMTVKFKDAESGRECINVMNGRWFDKRKIKAYLLDGEKFSRTKKGVEDDLEEEKRLERFEKWLVLNKNKGKETLGNGIDREEHETLDGENAEGE